MIIQTELGIAIKNAFGKYELIDFSLFNTSKINEYELGLTINKSNKGSIVITAKCHICNNIHKYNYNIDEFLKREIIVGGCEILGIPLFYIGNKSTIEERVYKQNQIFDKIYMMV
ncbi:hypothetical protein CF088_08030 [Clostridium botulinum]|uniref:hypothetical protein n=1 Tax=Clostridium botulinum TaxID=1491 RepID=UPI00077402DC|nr:hypothetical protein [Clostridium botulinum]APH22748.1 hypothetical protein NPD1_1458 [Clostridium botulinum]APQ70083.1 hypothetical protein RSJ8_3644 [Clostridium botulinum]MBN3377855.1 hypothetical protein [Clostridium botulinum]MBN3405236.1 hypothetical protein [Clostridium botulinum]QDY15708.1 hypothetical protein CGQ27_00800 [Clostridium botulinum]